MTSEVPPAMVSQRVNKKSREKGRFAAEDAMRTRYAHSESDDALRVL
jgi:hypothetical protein